MKDSDRKKAVAWAIFLVVISASLISTVAAYDLTLKYDEIVSSMEIPGTPSSIAYDPSNGFAYVSSYYANHIFVVNPRAGSIVDTIPGGIAPANVVYDPVNRYVYFSSEQSMAGSLVSSVDVIESSNNSLIAQIPMGQLASVNSMVVNPRSGTLFVSASSIFEINGTKLVARYGTLDTRCLITLNPTGSTMFLLSEISGTMWEANITNNANLSQIQVYSTGIQDSSNFYFGNLKNDGKLILGTDKELYVFNTSRPKSPALTIQIPCGVSSAYCCNSTHILYLSFYSQRGSINAYNVLNGQFAGTIRIPSSPDGFSGLSGSKIMVLSGGSLYVLSASLNNLQPNNFIFYGTATAAAASSLIALLVLLSIRKRGMK